MSKKEVGQTLKGLLSITTDLYEHEGDENLQAIIHTLNLAADVACMYSLKELDDIIFKVAELNDVLEDDGSFYRIGRHRGKYQLLRFV